MSKVGPRLPPRADFCVLVAVARGPLGPGEALSAMKRKLVLESGKIPPPKNNRIPGQPSDGCHCPHGEAPGPGEISSKAADLTEKFHKGISLLLRGTRGVNCNSLF